MFLFFIEKEELHTTPSPPLHLHLPDFTKLLKVYVKLYIVSQSGPWASPSAGVWAGSSAWLHTRLQAKGWAAGSVLGHVMSRELGLSCLVARPPVGAVLNCYLL